jgi:hypothetical protein
MGQHNLNRHNHRNVRWALSVSAALAVFAAFASPDFAQSSSGHNSTTGQITATRPSTPSHTMPPIRSMGAPVGTPIHNGARFGAVGPSSFTSSSAPPPSWELPRTVTPHWELGPNVPVQPNPVQGNHIHHNRGAFGVGYVGLPYYANPFAFGNAWDWNSDNETAQQEPPPAPARSEYAPQAPYSENPYEQGYGSPRAPYSPEAYPSPQADGAAPQSAAAQASEAPDDGLDHPPVTLLFNDGRPPEQVTSYVLTGSSIFISEHGHQRVIRVADLDLPATIEQNREAGVDFALPGTKK